VQGNFQVFRGFKELTYMLARDEVRGVLLYDADDMMQFAKHLRPSSALLVCVGQGHFQMNRWFRQGLWHRTTPLVARMAASPV
jgi:hypothetical protein